MPIIWMGFSVATSEDIEEWKHDPAAVKRYLEGVLGALSPPANLLELYYEVNRDRACALIKDLDDYVNLRTVVRLLGADEATKLVTAAAAKDGFALEPDLRTAGNNAAGGSGS
jgi:hypothetical protein